MRLFAYNDFDDDHTHVVVTLTEAEILDRYYPYWSREMLRVHRCPKITEANCVDDFVAVNWAWELPAHD